MAFSKTIPFKSPVGSLYTLLNYLSTSLPLPSPLLGELVLSPFDGAVCQRPLQGVQDSVESISRDEGDHSIVTVTYTHFPASSVDGDGDGGRLPSLAFGPIQRKVLMKSWTISGKRLVHSSFADSIALCTRDFSDELCHDIIPSFLDAFDVQWVPVTEHVGADLCPRVPVPKGQACPTFEGDPCPDPSVLVQERMSGQRCPENHARRATEFRRVTHASSLRVPLTWTQSCLSVRYGTCYHRAIVLRSKDLSGLP